MRVLKHHSIFLRRQGAFGLVGGLRGFEIHSLSKVLRHAKDFDYRFAPPMIQITVRSPSAASVAHAELRKIHARCDALLIAQDDRYAVWIRTLRCQSKDTPHRLCRMGLDNPAILVLRVMDISEAGRNHQRLARHALGPKADADLARLIVQVTGKIRSFFFTP